MLFIFSLILDSACKMVYLSRLILIAVIIDCVYIYYDCGTFNALYIGSVLILSGLVDKLTISNSMDVGNDYF